MPSNSAYAWVNTESVLGKVHQLFGTALPKVFDSVPVTTSQGTKSGTKLGTKLAPSRHQVEILIKASTGAALTQLMAIDGRSDRTKFRHQVRSPLLLSGLLEMTLPDKPTSSQQRYRLTAKGAAWLAAQAGSKK